MSAEGAPLFLANPQRRIQDWKGHNAGNLFSNGSEPETTHRNRVGVTDKANGAKQVKHAVFVLVLFFSVSLKFLPNQEF